MTRTSNAKEVNSSNDRHDKDKTEQKVRSQAKNQEPTTIHQEQRGKEETLQGQHKHSDKHHHHHHNNKHHHCTKQKKQQHRNPTDSIGALW
jgi:hypothetical protein